MGKNEYELKSDSALRDERIMIELVSGACPFLHIYEKFKMFFPSEQAMRQKLAQLVGNNYIQSKIYINHMDGTKFALYVLNEAGIKYLVENGYTADEIRTLLPSQHTVAHELVTTDVVRKFRWESMQIPYRLTYYDDPACRAHKKLLNLKAPIPDLLVDIELHNVKYRILVEVHMGTQPVLEVVDKVLKQEHQTLFMCNTSKNLEDLRMAMTEHAKLHEMVYFSLIHKFCESPGGIFGTDFRSIGGSAVSLYL